MQIKESEMQVNILQQDKFYGLNFWKVIMTFLIISSHFFSSFTNCFSFFTKGYIGVEFFFLTSGFLIYITFKKKGRTTWQFFKNRLKTLYPDYIIALILLCVIGFSFGFLQFIGVPNLIAEIFMLQNVGIVDGGLNYPAWYMSVLITASLVVYLMLRKLNRKTYNIVSIALIITIICGYMVFCGGRFEYWTNVAYVFCPVWFRGLMELLLGTLLAQLAEFLTIGNKAFLFIFEILTLIAIVLLVFCDIAWLDFLAIPLFSILILLSINPNSISSLIGKTKPFIQLNKITYIMYLNQALAIYMAHYLLNFLVIDAAIKVLICLAVFVFIIFVLPYLFKLLLKTIVSFFYKRKKSNSASQKDC